MTTSREQRPEHLPDEERAVPAPAASPAPVRAEHASFLDLQRLAGNATVARLAGDPAGRGAAPASEVVGAALQRSGASALPTSVRSRMEPALGQDLSGVRVRTDAASTEAVGARAYTLGDDIVVHPRETDREHVLAHEAVHVVQQRSGPVPGHDVGGGLRVSDPDDAFEREAEAVATGAASPAGAPRTERSGPGAGLQRFPATALGTPVPWRALTGSVVRPGEGASGGVYILRSAEEQPELRTVVVKPVFGQSGLGTKESAAQMTFGDRAVASLFGIKTPVSKGVAKGTPEFDQLVAVCNPQAPPRPADPGEAEAWKPLAEADSFVVMSEVPEGVSLGSLATKGATDANARAQLHSAVFSGAFLKKLGRLCVADLLIGNNDRMVARAMNLGNLMVSSGNELWAIDSNTVLGEMNPAQVLSAGTVSSSLQGGFSSTKGTFNDGPGDILDGFFDALARRLKQGAPEAEGGQEDQVDPAKLLKDTYDARREELVGAFAGGWASGLETVRELVETKEGRHKMRGLTDEVSGEEGGEEVRYRALKTNALYLAGRAEEGATHDEAAKSPATYAALTVLAEFDPASVEVPNDGHDWRVARVPASDVLGASLKAIDALPKPNRITHVKGNQRFTFNPAEFSQIMDAAQDAKDEVGELGKKRRGMFSKKEQPRNRVVAGRFVAETYQLGAAAMRAAGSIAGLERLGRNLSIATSGTAKPNQAARALPAADFLSTYLPRLRRDLGEYTDQLRYAAKGVAKLRHFETRRALADILDKTATYVEDGDERLGKNALEHPRRYADLLRSKASAH